MPATRLAAKSPMMPLARSRLRPAAGPATEPVRARAAGARDGPPTRGQPPPPPATAPTTAPIIPPAAGRSQRQPPHPPPLPPPLLAIPSPPRSSWHVHLLKPELLLCPPSSTLSLSPHAVGSESLRAGVREVKVLARSSVVTPSQTPGRVRRRKLQLLLAAAVATSSDGAHIAETPVIPDPKALAYLKAASCSMLLPRRRATYTLLMVSHGASGAPVGVRRTMRGA